MEAAELAALADTMLPGDELFPSAATVGAHGVLAVRLRDQALLGPLAAALEAGGGPLAGRVEAERARIVERLATEEPALFAALRTALYLAYYEQPAVVAVIRDQLGFDYNDAPLPRGYPKLAPFAADRDLPAPRGRYVPTSEVRRVDLSGLAFLEEGER